MKIIWDIFGRDVQGSDIADIPLEKLSTSALQKFYNMKLKGTAQRKQLSRRNCGISSHNYWECTGAGI